MSAYTHFTYTEFTDPGLETRGTETAAGAALAGWTSSIDRETERRVSSGVKRSDARVSRRGDLCPYGAGGIQ